MENGDQQSTKTGLERHEPRKIANEDNNSPLKIDETSDAQSLDTQPRATVTSQSQAPLILDASVSLQSAQQPHEISKRSPNSQFKSSRLRPNIEIASRARGDRNDDGSVDGTNRVPQAAKSLEVVCSPNGSVCYICVKLLPVSGIHFTYVSLFSVA